MIEATDVNVISAEDELREVVRAPSGYVVSKEQDRLDSFTRAFIELSPFMVLATSDADGRADSTPRGDPPGFVKVLSDDLLLIPDRKGNNRLDSMRNILTNPHAGTLFMIPGRKESLRVNGRATITRDQSLLEMCELNGRVPKLGILLEVEEVFFQCGASIAHSGAWDPSTWPDTSLLATIGQALKEQAAADLVDVDVEELDQDLEEWNSNRK
jgi:hypothetical protein